MHGLKRLSNGIVTNVQKYIDKYLTTKLIKMMKIIRKVIDKCIANLQDSIFLTPTCMIPFKNNVL